MARSLPGHRLFVAVSVSVSVSSTPHPYWGWGSIPDQYGRAWDGDDGESLKPKNPNGSDLPSIGPWQWRRDNQL